jgi:osmotically-inducible protein OsmY
MAQQHEHGGPVRERGAAGEDDGGILRGLADELGITRPVPADHPRSDMRVREDVCERLWRDPHVDVGEVSVEVNDGIVVLEGSVPQRQMKHRIEDIAAGTAGVHDVENRIRVSAGASPRGAGNV